MLFRKTMLPVVMMWLAGCSVSPQANQSEVESLDNMARNPGELAKTNQCSGEYDLMADLFSPELDLINIHTPEGQSTELLQTRVESALKAVPTEVQVAYFGLGGIVEVTELTHDICSQGIGKESKERLAEGKDKISGCWKHQKDFYKNDKGELVEDERVVIYVDANPEAIEHSLVRTFGYVLSQVLTKIDVEEGKPQLKTVEGDEHFEAAKENVALAFLADVANSNGKYSLERYEYLLGKDVLSADGMARQTAWGALKESEEKSAKMFMDYVFAEAFDSYFCSSATRETMEEDFAGAAEQFIPIAAAIRGLSSEMSKIDSVEELAELKDASDADSDEVTASSERPTASFELGNSAYGLWIIRGIFRGVGRVVGGIARGVVRVGAAVVRGAAWVARGALRIGAGILRATGRVVGAVFRGAARVVRGVVVGAGRVIRGVARGALMLGRAVVRGTGRVIHGLFGPWRVYAMEPGLVYEASLPDADGDGIADALDLCSATPAGARVHKTNKDWIGCAGGQFRDRDLQRRYGSNWVYYR